MNSLWLFLIAPPASAILIPAVRGTRFQSPGRCILRASLPPPPPPNPPLAPPPPPLPPLSPSPEAVQVGAQPPHLHLNETVPPLETVQVQVGRLVVAGTAFSWGLFLVRDRLIKRVNATVEFQATRTQTFRTVSAAVALFLLTITSCALLALSFFAFLLQGATNAKYEVDLLAVLFVGALLLAFATLETGANVGTQVSKLAQFDEESPFVRIPSVTGLLAAVAALANLFKSK